MSTVEVSKKKSSAKTSKKNKYGVCSEWNTPGDSHHLILHLRINPTETSSKDNESMSDLLKYRPELNLPPEAYEQQGSDSTPYRFENTNDHNASKLSLEDKQTEVSNESEQHPTYDTDTGRRISTSSTNNCNNAKEQSITKNEDTPGHVHGRVVPVPKSLQSADLDMDIGTMNNDTSIDQPPSLKTVHHPVRHCWWCTCSFQWEPYAIPLCRNRQTDTYDTTGTFCSPECCAAYIFGSNSRTSCCRTRGGDPWKQYEMLHRMVTKIVTKVAVRIKLAPPKETLQKFGGPYTVAEYRHILNDYRLDVRITMPPVNPLNGVTEEIPVDYVQQKKKFVPIDSSRVEKATNELRLKRKKKNQEENTLETFMQLRISS
jgi:hypothetical protein